MILHQQSPDCSDFDFTPAGSAGPAFRLLLPEHVSGAGLKTKYLHTVPGTWTRAGNGTRGRFCVDERIEIGIEILTTNAEAVITMTVTNKTDDSMTGVSANVCAAVNHTPGESEPEWSNPAFVPESVSLDRYAQGDYWFEQFTPQRLFALTNRGWVHMHPAPDNPLGLDRPRYAFEPSAEACARACAVESRDRTCWFYQAWDAPCRYCTPCAGNACMHLVVDLSPSLAPGEAVSVRGRTGLHKGDRDALTRHLG